VIRLHIVGEESSFGPYLPVPSTTPSMPLADMTVRSPEELLPWSLASVLLNQPLKERTSVRERLNTRQAAVVKRFVDLARREPQVHSVYIQFTEDEEAAKLWAVVPKWSWDVINRISDMVLDVLRDDQTAPVVFDVLTLDSISEADIPRATRHGERVYARH